MEKVKEETATDYNLVITRIINAPRELVFDVWTNPEHVKQWWSPKGFTNPVVDWDAKPGNALLVHMKGPDGVIYPMDGEFVEVIRPEKLVLIAGALNNEGKRMFEVLTTVTFEDEGGKTKLTMSAAPAKITPEAAPHLAGMSIGWNQSLDKLEDYVRKVYEEPFVIERTFNASAEKIWKAISDKDLMKKWYFDLKEFKPVVGFEFQFYGGPSPEKQFLHLCKITEVIIDKKLTYSWRFDGYEGNSFVTFELFPEGDKTKLRLTHAGIESFPISNPDFAKNNFAAGWTHLIGTSLKEFLENN